MPEQVEVYGGLLDGTRGTLKSESADGYLLILDDGTQVIVKAIGAIRETARLDEIPRELGS